MERESSNVFVQTEEPFLEFATFTFGTRTWRLVATPERWFQQDKEGQKPQECGSVICEEDGIIYFPPTGSLDIRLGGALLRVMEDAVKAHKANKADIGDGWEVGEAVGGSGGAEVISSDEEEPSPKTHSDFNLMWEKQLAKAGYHRVIGVHGVPKIVRDGKWLICPVCGKRYKTAGGVGSHLREFHGAKIGPDVEWYMKEQ